MVYAGLYLDIFWSGHLISLIPIRIFWPRQFQAFPGP